MALDGTLHRVFVQNLRVMRKAKKLSQGKMAERLGMSQSAYAQWENGHSCPTLNTVERFATALGVTHRELLSTEKLEAVA